MIAGIPRALSFYYLFPFYRTFLKELGIDHLETPSSTAKDLDNMKLCPTDEPCVSVKIAFSHAKALLDHGVQALFVPCVVSLSSKSYCCPKMMGLPSMLKAGLGLEDREVLSPVIDVKDSPRRWQETWVKAAAAMGVSGRGARARILGALETAQRVQTQAEENMARYSLSIGDYCDQGDEGFPPWRMATSASGGDSGWEGSSQKVPTQIRGGEASCRTIPPVGLMGHAYILHDIFGRKVVELLRAYGPVILPEMVPTGVARHYLRQVLEGEKMWAIEGHILGASLYLLRQRKVGRLVLLSAFSCGPASVIENYISWEAERSGVPFLNLTVDEHTGEAGLVTRIEAFMDACQGKGLRNGGVRKTRVGIGDATPGDAREAGGGCVHRGPIGLVNMGNLNIPLLSLLQECGTEVKVPGPLSDRVVSLGKELAPEFICYPMVTLLGQMRELISQGADRILMVGGKGRCRLGWYAQVMEGILNRAGYPVEVLAVDSPFPWKEKGNAFLATCAEFLGKPGARRILKGASLALMKLVLLDQAHDLLRDVRAREERRGEGDIRYRGFLRDMEEASSLTSSIAAFKRYSEDLREVKFIQEKPLHVSIVGEIYVVNEPFVTKDLERILGSLEQRVRVHRRLTVTGWAGYHLFKMPRAVRDYREVVRAANRYIPVSVGGHGQETVGEVVLAKRRGMDGVVHLFPFTCMPEIIAQNILAKVSRDLDIPVLSLMISEQTGVAGLTTRLEAFCDLLAGRRKKAVYQNDVAGQLL